MKKSSLFIILTLGIIFNSTFAQIIRCGLENPAEKVRIDYSKLSGIYERNSGAVPVVFHVIYSLNNEGNVSDNTIQNQFNVLSNAYSSISINYFLAGITRTQNNSWFNISVDGTALDDAREELNIDSKHVLNVYITKLTDAYGVSKYPWSVPENSDQHGCVIDYRTMPGGSLPGVDQGKTLVHESGHYWGLYHTFGENCREDADEVDDTPIQKGATSGCPPDGIEDSCPYEAGFDAIHNYMDYSDDDCLWEFSPGQIERMWAMRDQYRPGIGGSTTYFSDNLDIGSNQSYEFRKGTYKFSSGKKINVYGALKTDGSSSSPVRLTSSGSSWNGIYFAPGSQGDLQHADIDNLSGGSYSGAITIAAV